MGSPFQLIFYADDSASATRLAAESFALIDSLNFIFSDYLPNSRLNQLSTFAGRDSFIATDHRFLHLLQVSIAAAEKSKGAFDITIGPLSRLWRAARKEKQFPTAAAIAAARAKTGWRFVVLDPANSKVKLLQQGMLLDMGGIAKGYVADQVIRLLHSRNITAALADAGGDIVCSGPPPGKTGWNIGINFPGMEDQLLKSSILIRDAAVATSGDLYQFLEHGGKRYAHIIDPRTGYGVTFQRNVTVVAADGTTADWLATACSILSLRRSKKLVRRHGAGLLVTQHKNGSFKRYQNRRMKSYLQQQ